MSGSRALVTGASSGIGEAFARQLARTGSGVVLVARNEGRLRELAGEISAAHGVDAEVLPADLRDVEQLAAVERRAGSTDDPIDLLVNNAGYLTCGSFHGLDVEEETGQVDVHVRATLRLTHAATGPMSKRGRGGVINVASTAAFQAAPGLATYAAAKAFVLSFSEALHEELRGHGVTVTCLCPGFTRTELQQRADADMGHVPGLMWQTPDEVARTALRGHAGGRAVVVPGAVNRALAASARVVPRPVSRKVAARVMRPG
ncbi:MAG: SDR family NAD(P)-dependent oxidoreductase [Carbonactinosporaceae bacterium]